MTTTSLLDAAQTLIDMFYQDYPPEDAFIDIATVTPLLLSEYERLLLDEFNRAKLMARAIEGFSGVVEMDTEAVIIEVLDVVKDGDQYVARMSGPFFSYGPFDSMASGVQRVRNMSQECKHELVRINAKDRWTAAIIPTTSKLFYYPQTLAKSNLECPEAGRIVLIGSCHPKKIEVEFIPGLGMGGDMQIATRFVKRVIDAVLQSLLIAKKEVVVDKTNDLNPNAVLATEANPDNVK